MKRTAIVTGGAGFIGSHLSMMLNRNNYNVIVYDDLSNGSGKRNLSKNIKIIKSSILNANNLRNTCKKADVVFHLAVKPLTMSFNKPEDVVKVNDFGTYLVAKICADVKCKMIHISSSEVYGSALSLPMKENHPIFPSTVYAASKAASEMYVEAYQGLKGLKAVIVRPFNSYGEFMRIDLYSAVFPKFFKKLSENKSLVIYGTGNQTRDFTYVEDTCRGIILADQTKNAVGDVFNIGQGKETSVNKLAKLMIKSFQKITGKKFTGSIKYCKSREGDVKRHLSDISHSKKILGYKPTIKIEEGVDRYVNWCLKFSSKKK